MNWAEYYAIMGSINRFIDTNVCFAVYLLHGRKLKRMKRPIHACN